MKSFVEKQKLYNGTSYIAFDCSIFSLTNTSFSIILAVSNWKCFYCIYSFPVACQHLLRQNDCNYYYGCPFSFLIFVFFSSVDEIHLYFDVLNAFDLNHV